MNRSNSHTSLAVLLERARNTFASPVTSPGIAGSSHLTVNSDHDSGCSYTPPHNNQQNTYSSAG